MVDKINKYTTDSFPKGFSHFNNAVIYEEDTSSHTKQSLVIRFIAVKFEYFIFKKVLCYVTSDPLNCVIVKPA